MVKEIPSDLQKRPFLLSEAHALGVDRGVLRGRRFRRMFTGVYVSSDLPDTLGLRADGAALLLPRDAVFSHHTAAALRSLPVPDSAEVHVTLARDRTVPRVTGIRVHRLYCEADETELVDGRCLTTCARTWVDLAAHLRFGDLVVLGDATLFTFRLTPDQKRAGPDRAGRGGGPPRAPTAPPPPDPRAESAAEPRPRLILIRAGLPRPEAGLDLYDADWAWVARPDLLYRDPPVVIQYDGGSHFRSERQRRQDVARDELTRELNYEVVVVPARDLYQEHRLVARVVAARERATGRKPCGFLVDPDTRRPV